MGGGKVFLPGFGFGHEFFLYLITLDIGKHAGAGDVPTLLYFIHIIGESLKTGYKTYFAILHKSLHFTTSV